MIQADAFVELTAVLLAPVLALSEPLAVYRIHGNKLSYPDWIASTPEALRRRAVSYITVLTEVRAWIREHENELQRIDTRSYLLPQLFEMREAQFLAAAPGRLRSFWFLLRQNRTFGFPRSWKREVFRYFTAFLALPLGYSRACSVSRRALGGFQTFLKKI